MCLVCNSVRSSGLGFVVVSIIMLCVGFRDGELFIVFPFLGNIIGVFTEYTLIGERCARWGVWRGRVEGLRSQQWEELCDCSNCSFVLLLLYRSFLDVMETVTPKMKRRFKYAMTRPNPIQ
jgi:uncharacterized membrane protein